MAPPSTPRVPGYEITGVLGHGSFGAVFRAVQTSLDREVALKVRSSVLGPDRLELLRFQRETRLHLRLSHPHVVPLYDAGDSEEGPYLAMELMERGSLARRLEGGKRLPPDQAAALVATLADGLAYLHEEGILHRDLKPGNILIGARGELKLADLGLARADVQTLLTQDRELIGTILYLAPECLTDSPPSPAADVYALGLILWEMLVGRSAIRADSMREALDVITKRGPMTPRQAAGLELPPGLDPLLMSMLARDPTARPDARTCHERLAAIAPAGAAASARILSGPVDQPSASGAPTVAAPAPRRPTGRTGRPPAPRSGVGRALVAGAASLLVVTFLILRSRETSVTPLPSEPAPPPAASPSPATATTMTALLDEARSFRERYERSCPPNVVPSAGYFVEDVPAFGHHRTRVGDLSLLFSALSRLIAAVRLGDERAITGTPWIELGGIAFDIEAEALRSGGLDATSLLKAPLASLEKELAAGGPDRWRRWPPRLLQGLRRYYAEVDTDSFVELFDAEEAYFSADDPTLAAWHRTTAGRAVQAEHLLRMNLFLMVLEAMEPSRKPQAKAHWRRLEELLRRQLAMWKPGEDRSPHRAVLDSRLVILLGAKAFEEQPGTPRRAELVERIGAIADQMEPVLLPSDLHGRAATWLSPWLEPHGTGAKELPAATLKRLRAWLGTL